MENDGKMIKSRKDGELLYLFLAPLAVIGFWIGVEALLENFSSSAELLKRAPILRTLPYLFALLLLVAFEKHRMGKGWKSTLDLFGLKSPRAPQLKITFIGIAILAIGYTLSFYLWGEAPELRTTWPSSALKFMLEAGLAEELLFRGFLFRRLRERYSFARSACLSGLVFGSIHLINLTNGLSSDVLVSVGISILAGVLVAFPLAALFEVGRGSLLGGIVFHFAVDTINLFQGVGSVGMFACLGIAALSALVVFFLSFRALRARGQNPSGRPGQT